MSVGFRSLEQEMRFPEFKPRCRSRPHPGPQEAGRENNCEQPARTAQVRRNAGECYVRTWFLKSGSPLWII